MRLGRVKSCPSVFILLLVVVGVMTAHPKTLAFFASLAGQQAQAAESVLSAPYYNARDFLATLVVNNKAPVPIEFVISFFDLNGKRLDVPAVIEANSFREIHLGQLLRDAERVF